MLIQQINKFLFDKIKSDLAKAQKERDEAKVSILRFLLAAIHNFEIEKYPPEKGGLTDEDVISVIQKLVKTHKESIEAFKTGGREDLVKQEEAELAILKKYLPESISEEEIRKAVVEIVKEMGAVGSGDFGKVMGEVMGKLRDRADGATVAKIVKEVLGG
ncbi:MAG: hypothetical protein LiPW16_264 [Microgenomates group bacterium LiPW_16]|nr:MAG: hypothetical protein LiPW16_264 [Microgenomates group bacterium LiPW_16]